jgi:hypothetical protein
MEGTLTGQSGDELQFDVFISYSRKDIDFARVLQRYLSNYSPPRDLPVAHRRLRVFRDESDFQGVEYESALEKNLKNASKLLVVASISSKKSPLWAMKFDVLPG